MTTTNEPTLHVFGIDVTISGYALIKAATVEEARAQATEIQSVDIDHKQGHVTIAGISIVSADELVEIDGCAIDEIEAEQQADNCREPAERTYCDNECGEATTNTRRNCEHCDTATDCCDQCDACKKCGNPSR
ncbi:hypothetical protein ACFOY2_46100 [Nonomuraea purpurea]|uniref:Uncharacterized protein n=1 Tax=Nonomuraea purpurea TaxID=1849276 RepID=A0ABV8GP85_9ACTN